MKLSEITDEDSTPLLIILMQQLLKKGDRIAWFSDPDKNINPWWIVKIERKVRTVANAPTQWIFTYAKHLDALHVEPKQLGYNEAGFENEFELIPSNTKGIWRFRRRPD